MKIIIQLKSVFLFLTAVLVLCQAQNIRGSVESEEGEERDLGYYKGNQASNGAYRNYYSNGARNYGYRRYYPRYYGNGGNNRNRYYNRQYNKYYQGGDEDDGAAQNNDDLADDAAANDDGNIDDDGGYNPYDDDTYNSNSTSWYDGNAWVSKAMSYEEEAERSFWAWYATPPGEWTALQWAWFSGLMVLLVGISFCTCMCCSNCQEESAAATKTRKQSEYDFDDYTSVDSKRSFMTSNSSADTEWDDNATYDSIMRLRSD